jgi:molecular chaperone HtpG
MNTKTKAKAEKLDFGADVSRLLGIVAHALYSNRDVFLRELISNSADACDRLRYEAVQKPELVKKDANFKIRVFKDAEARTLTITDNGIGMSREELIDNLGTIAKSGTATLMEQLSNTKNEEDKLNLIGQFGVGFYASFMVSDDVQVISRKAGEKETYHWSSDGQTGYEIREASKEEAELIDGNRGTVITLKINDDASDYLLDEKLIMVIRTYSDHINFPIYIGNPAKMDQEALKDEKPINAASALWTRPKHEISDEQYTEFYKHIGHGFDDPLLTAHWRAEGKIEYSALLFAPTMRPWDLYDPKRKHCVRLYVRQVFITDDCEGLIYPWLRFLRGVIDTPDLPLNISREMLQHNPVMARIRNNVAKKILKELDGLSKSDKEAFNTFWGQFGAALKEGLYDAHEHREDIFKVCRFYSTHKENELTSLADYVSRMKEGQENIFFISGENIDTVKNSPQIEGFKAKNIEVLFFTDTIDDFWLQMADSFDGKMFKSVTKGDIDLNSLGSKEENKEEKDDKKDKTDNKKIDALINVIKEFIKEEVGDVRISTRLTDSPVCLIASDGAVDMNMERVLKIHQKYDPDQGDGQNKRVLEINPNHPLIDKLANIADSSKDSDELRDASWLLLDQARIIQGEPVPDPTTFARRMAQFMEKGLAA